MNGRFAEETVCVRVVKPSLKEGAQMPAHKRKRSCPKRFPTNPLVSHNDSIFDAILLDIDDCKITIFKNKQTKHGFMVTDHAVILLRGHDEYNTPGRLSSFIYTRMKLTPSDNDSANYVCSLGKACPWNKATKEVVLSSVRLGDKVNHWKQIQMWPLETIMKMLTVGSRGVRANADGTEERIQGLTKWLTCVIEELRNDDAVTSPPLSGRMTFRWTTAEIISRISSYEDVPPPGHMLRLARKIARMEHMDGYQQKKLHDIKWWPQYARRVRATDMYARMTNESLSELLAYNAPRHQPADREEWYMWDNVELLCNLRSIVRLSLNDSILAIPACWQRLKYLQWWTSKLGEIRLNRNFSKEEKVAIIISELESMDYPPTDPIIIDRGHKGQMVFNVRQWLNNVYDVNVIQRRQRLSQFEISPEAQKRLLKIRWVPLDKESYYIQNNLYCVQWCNINPITWNVEPIPLYKIGRGIVGREQKVHGTNPVRYKVLKRWENAGHLERAIHRHPMLAALNKRWDAGVEWFAIDLPSQEEVVTFIDSIVNHAGQGVTVCNPSFCNGA